MFRFVEFAKLNNVQMLVLLFIIGLMPYDKTP